MTKREKRLEKARLNPRSLSFDELCQIYTDHGAEIRSGGKGSHFVARFPNTTIRPRTFKKSNPIKIPYVRDAFDAIEELKIYQEKLGEGDE